MMKTAIILSAGRGSRLSKLTRFCPKPLVPVNDITPLERHIKKLSNAGVETLVINHAYLGGKIREEASRFKHQARIVFSPEPPGGLETGGGMVNALDHLGEAPFWAVNGDIVTDFDFSSFNPSSNHLAHLILVPKPVHLARGDFGLDQNGKVNNHHKAYTFSGIAVYHPNLFKALKVGFFSITPILRELIEKNLVTGTLYQGTWIDIGSPVEYERAIRLGL